MIEPGLTHNAPASGLTRYWLGRTWYWLTGWEVVGQVPEYKKFVLIGAHHTSNWDFAFALFATFIFRLKTSWMAKRSLFFWPLGFLMRSLGGWAVDRSSPHGVVEQTVKQLQQSEQLVIALATDGTRKKMEHWKSGFYWIALNAQIPIACFYLDYEKKQAGIGLTFIPTGNVKEDMDRIRDFYKDVQARRPQNVTPVQLADETKKPDCK